MSNNRIIGSLEFWNSSEQVLMTQYGVTESIKKKNFHTSGPAVTATTAVAQPPAKMSEKLRMIVAAELR
jgi:hypothetical protein